MTMYHDDHAQPMGAKDPMNGSPALHALERLNEEVEKLDEQVEILERELTFVLGPDPAEMVAPGEAHDPEDQQSQLTHSLRGLRRRVSGIARRVETINTRVEV